MGRGGGGGRFVEAGGMNGRGRLVEVGGGKGKTLNGIHQCMKEEGERTWILIYFYHTRVT